MIIKKRKRPFSQWPRHRRRERVLKVKQAIERTSAEYGGIFTSDLVLNEHGRPPVANQWFDFSCLGRDRFTYFNATIMTANQVFWDQVSELAFQRVVDQLTPEQYAAEFDFRREPGERLPGGKIITYQLVTGPSACYPQFDGRTFSEQLRLTEQAVIDSEPPVVFEEFRVFPEYPYGIGLDLVIDAECINREVIEQAIARFRAGGERPWRASEAVPRERLPSLGEIATFRQLEIPSVLLGQALR